MEDTLKYVFCRCCDYSCRFWLNWFDFMGIDHYLPCNTPRQVSNGNMDFRKAKETIVNFLDRIWNISFENTCHDSIVYICNKSWFIDNKFWFCFCSSSFTWDLAIIMLILDVVLDVLCNVQEGIVNFLAGTNF